MSIHSTLLVVCHGIQGLRSRRSRAIGGSEDFMREAGAMTVGDKLEAKLEAYVRCCWQDCAKSSLQSMKPNHSISALGSPLRLSLLKFITFISCAHSQADKVVAGFETSLKEDEEENPGTRNHLACQKSPATLHAHLSCAGNNFRSLNLT